MNDASMALILDQLADELEQLRQWKAEAIEVLIGWERCFTALGVWAERDLGRMKSDIVLDFIRKMQNCS